MSGTLSGITADAGRVNENWKPYIGAGFHFEHLIVVLRSELDATHPFGRTKGNKEKIRMVILIGMGHQTTTIMTVKTHRKQLW